MSEFFDAPIEGGENLYAKMKQGDNKLRILTSAKVGWEGWWNNKPVRFASDYDISADEYATLDKDNYNPDKAKYRQFAVCIVWNYTDKAVQIYQFTQKAVMNGLMSLAKDEDWGDVTKYDIKVNRTGESTDTKYSVTPLPKTDVDKEIHDKFMESGLTPAQFISDKKNSENVKAFQEAAKKPNDDTIKPDGIPF